MKLSELCEVVRGSSPRPKGDARYYGGNVPRLMVADLTRDGKLVTPRIDSLTEAGAKLSRPMKKGDVVIAVSGNPGLPAILNADACIHDGFAGLRNLDNSKISTDFLYRFLIFVKDKTNSGAVGAIFKNLTTDQIKNLEIPLPPLLQQKRIAEVLDKADALREKRRLALQKLDTLLQSVFLEMFGKNDFPQITIGELLERNILLLHKDGNHGGLYPRAEEFGDSGVPFLSAKCVTDEGLINHNLIEHLKTEKANKLRIGWIEKGDVLLAHNASVGKVALYLGEYEKALIGTSLTAFRPNQKLLTSNFLWGVFRSNFFQRQLEKNMGQTTRNQVPITAQRQLKIILPPLELQDKFSNILSNILGLKRKNQNALSDLDNLFQSLQQRAFKGELFNDELIMIK